MRRSAHRVLPSQSSFTSDAVESVVIGSVVGGAGDAFLHFLGIGVSASEVSRGGLR